jgi:hypothetical protein
MALVTAVASGARMATVRGVAMSPAVATASCARRGWSDGGDVRSRGSGRAGRERHLG